MLFLLLPKREVLLEKLDDGLGISECLLVNIVDLFKSVRKSLFTELTGLLVVVHDLVVEHGEVQSKTQSNWVAGI